PNAVEQATGERVYAMVDLALAASDPGGVGRPLAQYPPSLHRHPGARHLAWLSGRGAAVRRRRARGGGIKITDAGTDPRSPVYQHAEKVCRKDG
ncbi:MAG: hypothetical protein ACRDNS_10250, partial [Trebonia sp.]